MHLPALRAVEAADAAPSGVPRPGVPNLPAAPAPPRRRQDECAAAAEPAAGWPAAPQAVQAQEGRRGRDGRGRGRRGQQAEAQGGGHGAERHAREGQPRRRQEARPRRRPCGRRRAGDRRGVRRAGERLLRVGPLFQRPAAVGLGRAARRVALGHRDAHLLLGVRGGAGVRHHDARRPRGEVRLALALPDGLLRLPERQARLPPAADVLREVLHRHPPALVVLGGGRRRGRAQAVQAMLLGHQGVDAPQPAAHRPRAPEQPPDRQFRREEGEGPARVR
mmetsp:Transcript_34123/g.93807  ORF Transcript_34123/g.93807 Transcript_34123/m.93807 type:complete len:278 (+) Transcript_34123:346-1179(+)